MTNLRTEQSSVWNPAQLLRQVRRKDTGEIITGPAAAQAGRTVDGSPTEIEGEVLVGGWSWLGTGEFLTEESYNKYYVKGGLSYGHWSDKETACMEYERKSIDLHYSLIPGETSERLFVPSALR